MSKDFGNVQTGRREALMGLTAAAAMAGFGSSATALADTLQALPSGFVSQTVHANGIDIHYVSTGRGPSLVLLHGWPEFWLTWRPVAERLRDRFTLIMPDLRGFGRTRNPIQGPTDIESADLLADDLAALERAIGVEHAGIVSHDVGAYVAQSFARRHPDLTTRLFFFNCPTPGVGNRWIADGHVVETWYQYFNTTPMAAALATSSREACQVYIGYILKHWSHVKTAFDEDMEAWIDNFMSPGVMQGGFDWYIGGQADRLKVIEGKANALPKISMPTRVFWGANDVVNLPEWTDRLGETFEDIQIGFAAQAGHFVHREQPDIAADTIAAFFSAR